jgi:hypothetical protein
MFCRCGYLAEKSQETRDEIPFDMSARSRDSIHYNIILGIFGAVTNGAA